MRCVRDQRVEKKNSRAEKRPDDAQLTDESLATGKRGTAHLPKPVQKAVKRGTDHNFATFARRVVEQAIGERLDGSPLPDKAATLTRSPWASSEGGKAARRGLNGATRLRSALDATRSRSPARLIRSTSARRTWSVRTTMRMSMRRFTRLTNAFSRKVENHTAAIALYFMYYRFARVHQTLRVTLAMAAGISDRVWSIEEIVDLQP
jgi:hypothetical protein